MISAHDSPTQRSTKLTSFSASSWKCRAAGKSAMLAFCWWSVSSVYRQAAIVIGVTLLTLEQDQGWSRWQNLRSEKRNKKLVWRLLHRPSPSASVNSSRRQKRRKSLTRRKQAQSEDHLTIHRLHRQNLFTATNTMKRFSARSFSTTQRVPTRSDKRLSWNNVDDERIRGRLRISTGPRTTSIFSPTWWMMSSGVNAIHAAGWSTNVPSFKRSSSMHRPSNLAHNIKHQRENRNR